MRQISKNSIIYFPEDIDQKLYFLKTGKVKLSYYSTDGKEMILSLLSPGEVFGELALLGDGIRNEIAKVVDDVLLCSISVDQLEKMLDKNPVFNRQITKLIGLRLKKAQSRLTSLVFKSAPERVRAFIKELADEHSRLGCGVGSAVRWRLIWAWYSGSSPALANGAGSTAKQLPVKD